MKRIGQKGFSAPHLLLVVLVVAMIGGVGYYVFQANKDINKNLDATNSSQNEPQKQDMPEGRAEEESLYKTFKNDDPALSFAYPKTWKKSEPNQIAGAKVEVKFTSPDYTPKAGSSHGEITNGGVIIVQVRKSAFKNITELKNSEGVGSPISPEDITVAGIPAIKEAKCGHPLPMYICVSFIKDGDYYNINYLRTVSENSTNAKYLEEFNYLLDSFKFN